MRLAIHSLVFVLGALIECFSYGSALHGGVVSVDVVGLNLGQVELLWPKDGTWTSDTNPADERLSRDLEVLHSPETD